MFYSRNASHYIFFYVTQDNEIPVPCQANGRQRKCHIYGDDILPFENPPCCECIHGTVFNGSSCIDESRCPCKVNGTVRLPDEKWTDEGDKCLIRSK